MNSSLLDHLVEGNELRVVGFTGDPALKRRLSSLGLRRGALFRVLHVNGRHRIVVTVGLGQIALGREVLLSLEVAPLSNESPSS